MDPELFNTFDVLTAITGKPVTMRPYPQTAVRDVLTWMKRPADWAGDEPFVLAEEDWPAAAEARTALLAALPKMGRTLDELDAEDEVTEGTLAAWRVIWAHRLGDAIELPKLED